MSGNGLSEQGSQNGIKANLLRMGMPEVLPGPASTAQTLSGSFSRLIDLCRRLAVHTAVHSGILIVAALLITTKDITVGDFRTPDAWAHAMNGVYLLDLIKQMPLGHFWDFTLSYYARYPAISLPYHPPGLPLLEMVLFAILGVSPAVARFSIVLFAVLGIIAWYHLARSTHGKTVAFLSGLLILANTTVVIFSRQVMLEIPTLAVTMLSMYCLYKAIENNSRAHLYWWAITAGASVWFKQSALFILPLSLSFYLLRRKSCKHTYRDLLVSLAIVTVAITPVLFTTWYFGGSAFHQAVMKTGTYGIAKSSVANWLFYLRLLPHLVPVPVLIAASVSLVLLLWKKRWEKHLVYLLWLVWVYAMASYISVKEIRYTFFLIPPFYLLACSIVDEIRIKIKGVKIATALLGCICLVQCVSAYQVRTPVIVGYDQAAKFVVDNWHGKTVLVSARYHGNFTFNVRRFDPAGKVMVLRAEKAIPALRVKPAKWKEEYLYDALRTLGTRYIVVETLDWRIMPELTRLRSYLPGDRFALRKKIDVTNTTRGSRGASILIYEFLGELDPSEKPIEMLMPKMRRKLMIPLKPYNEPPP